ncbi:MAG: O-antigen ligase family protein, partial [Acidobacteriota bacterium]
TGKLLRANQPLVLFFLYCGISLLWSDFPEVAVKRWTKALGDFVMILIVLTDLHPFAAVRRLLTRVTFLLIPLSTMFIKYFPEFGRAYGRWDYKTYYTGVTTNKNTLGGICLIFGLASLWSLLSAWRSRREPGRGRRLLAHAVILAMVLWLFSMANSMTSLACFLLTCPLVWAAGSGMARRRTAWLHAMVAAVVAFALFALFLSTGLLATIGRDPTLTDRTAIWGLVVSLVRNPLTGTGFESFWLGPRLASIWRIYSWGPAEAHNGYIEIYLNLGGIGLLLLAGVLVTGYRTVMDGVRARLPAAGLMLAYFTVGIIYNFTEAAFFRMMAPVWIVLMLALSKIPRSVRDRELASRPVSGSEGTAREATPRDLSGEDKPRPGVPAFPDRDRWQQARGGHVNA